MSAVKHLHGVITDSVGGTATVDGQVTVYDTPTVRITVPATASAGTVVKGSVSFTKDADLTATATLTLDGQPLSVAADGSFSFTP